MGISTGLIAVLALQAAGGAISEPDCVAPDVPTVERPQKPVRPQPPGCVDEARSRHTCSNRVINAYNAEMVRYRQAFTDHVAEINAYNEKLATYLESAAAYVECEQHIVMPSLLIEG